MDIDKSKTYKVNDFLILTGFKNKGARGRMSELQKKAVEVAIEEGVKFYDWNSETRSVDKGATVNRIVANPTELNTGGVWARVRGADLMIVTTEFDVVVALDTHDVCSRPIYACVCTNLRPPAYYKNGQFELMTKDQWESDSRYPSKAVV